MNIRPSAFNTPAFGITPKNQGGEQPKPKPLDLSLSPEAIQTIQQLQATLKNPQARQKIKDSLDGQ